MRQLFNVRQVLRVGGIVGSAVGRQCARAGCVIRRGGMLRCRDLLRGSGVLRGSGHGVGRALLLGDLALLAARGARVVRLMVDAQNVTGAVRVYEHAGMDVERRFEVFSKPLG